MPVLLRCHKGIGPVVTGTALVAADNFSARYDLDRIKGIFSRPGHKLAGESYVDRILVLDQAKGGVATAWMLHEMAARGVVPRRADLQPGKPDPGPGCGIWQCRFGRSLC